MVGDVQVTEPHLRITHQRVVDVFVVAAVSELKLPITSKPHRFFLVGKFDAAAGGNHAELRTTFGGHVEADVNDPMVSEEHITAFGWAAPQELDDIMALAIRVNDFLTGLFLGVGIRLVDFKIECGRHWEGDNMRILVADEISPDSCRLWDIKTGDKMDKDRFRKDLGGMIEAYTEVARRLGVMTETEAVPTGGPKLVK